MITRLRDFSVLALGLVSLLAGNVQAVDDATKKDYGVVIGIGKSLLLISLRPSTDSTNRFGNYLFRCRVSTLPPHHPNSATLAFRLLVKSVKDDLRNVYLLFLLTVFNAVVVLKFWQMTKVTESLLRGLALARKRDCESLVHLFYIQLVC